MTGLSRLQITRLIASYARTGALKERSYRRNLFSKHYPESDIELLASRRSARKAKRTRRRGRSYRESGSITATSAMNVWPGSRAAHIYNLRKSLAYRKEAPALREDRTGADWHRRTPAARSARQAGLPARGHWCIKEIGRHESGPFTGAFQSVSEFPPARGVRQRAVINPGQAKSRSNTSFGSGGRAAGAAI
jgi:hypothetical protein